MAETTSIEWTDSTWNPLRARRFELQADGSGKERIGWHCEPASPGCTGCYAEAFNRRLGTGREYKAANLVHATNNGDVRGDVVPFLDEKILLKPLDWKRPRKIFPCSMTDLFADFVTDEQLDRIFAVMALTPWHTYQVLTKRAKRMREYFSNPLREVLIGQQVSRTHLERTGEPVSEWSGLPMPRVWLGVSAEDQRRANERIIHLLRTPAAVRWVSAEPVLEELRLWKLTEGDYEEDPMGAEVYPLRGLYAVPDCDWNGPKLDWVVAGGESGPKARPAQPDWFRSLRDQCAAEAAMTEGQHSLASRGLRPAAELAKDRDHGDRLRYIAGCRCDKCRSANTAYERTRAKARKAGDWNGIVSAARAREHMAELSRRGVGRHQVADASGIADSILFSIVAGKRPQIRARTARSILSVTVEAAADRALIDARPTWRLLDELLSSGYTKADLARALGYSTPALQIKRTQCTVRTAFEVQRMHERLRKVRVAQAARLLAELREEGYRPARIVELLGGLDIEPRGGLILASTATAIASLHAQLTGVPAAK
ncbi:MAG TPA: DUF5131 family protein [Albitalea sp.]|nr:DUF5131 family protein [Albitalea sp.]